MSKHLNISEINTTGGVYIGGQTTNLTMDEIILRAAKRAYPEWAHEYSTPVKIPGAYNVYAVGTNGDVTLLVWEHHGDFSVQHACW